MLVLGYRLGLDLKEVHRRVGVENTIVVDVSPTRRVILDLAILLSVVVHVVANHIVPAVDAGNRRLVVEQSLCRVAQLVECLDIYLAIVLIFEYLADKWTIVRIAPLQRVVATRVALHAAVARGAEGVVVVERYEEEFVILLVRRVEVDVVVVLVVPVVIPHSHHDIHRIGAEQQTHVAHLRNPVVELLTLEACEVLREGVELLLCLLKILDIAL